MAVRAFSSASEFECLSVARSKRTEHASNVGLASWIISRKSLPTGWYRLRRSVIAIKWNAGSRDRAIRIGLSHVRRAAWDALDCLAVQLNKGSWLKKM